MRILVVWPHRGKFYYFFNSIEISFGLRWLKIPKIILWRLWFMSLYENVNWAIQEKTQMGVELRAWNFRGYWKKSMWKFQGLVKIEMKFQSVFTKNLWNFHGSWFLTLEFPRGVTQFCRISRDSDKCKNSRVLLFRKVYPHPLLLYFFWNRP